MMESHVMCSPAEHQLLVSFGHPSTPRSCKCVSFGTHCPLLYPADSEYPRNSARMCAVFAGLGLRAPDWGIVCILEAPGGLMRVGAALMVLCSECHRRRENKWTGCAISEWYTLIAAACTRLAGVKPCEMGRHGMTVSLCVVQ